MADRGGTLPTMSTSNARTTPIELAARNGGGVGVSLFWDRPSGPLWVDVLDVATGQRFEVAARREGALDVYYDPFAYGPCGRRARRGLDELAAAARD
jgi:hypothetical protein